MENKRDKKDRRSRDILAWALLVSLAGHAVFMLTRLPGLLSGDDKNAFHAPHFKEQEKKIELVMDPRLVERAKQSAAIAHQQIVASEQNGRKEAPVDSRFLGESNQAFDRQTVARKIDKFKAAAKGIRDGHMAANEALSASKKSPGKKGIKKKFGDLTFADLAFGDGGEEEAQAEKKAAGAGMQQGLENGTDTNPGLASNNDYIQDIPLGDMTNLNTTEFKYYGFYFRIRQKLEQYWGNSLKEKATAMFKSGRKIASGTDMITSLVITLNSQGRIVDVKVKGTSGVRELDEAAIESFNKAGPFPNPPKGMASPEGLIKIEWGFVVKS